MKRKNNSLSELISLLEALPDNSESVELSTEKLLIDIINEIQKENLFEMTDADSAIEITVKSGTYICVLNNKRNLERIYRVTS